MVNCNLCARQCSSFYDSYCGVVCEYYAKLERELSGPALDVFRDMHGTLTDFKAEKRAEEVAKQKKFDLERKKSELTRLKKELGET